MLKTRSQTVAEYIWIDGHGNLRSKTRVLQQSSSSNIPEWNYDGSSTFQAFETKDTEITLKPCAYYLNPLRTIPKCDSILVLCETYDSEGNPLPSNTRHEAKIIFNSKIEEQPWFGLEQEYYMFIKHSKNSDNFILLDNHYCGTQLNSIQRKIAEEHLNACLAANINISGLNAEVSNNQWEFQIGPCTGIQAGDDLCIARYLLERIAEKYDFIISYHPKPYPCESGSGCHVNFSTASTRSENGLDIIHKYIDRLEKNHSKDILNYGMDNRKRLTGTHETASYDSFSWGIGTRNTSIRIGNTTFKEKMGYFEDRRPAANIDPYMATSQLFKTCCVDDI
jgi:glutamine synthetase